MELTPGEEDGVRDEATSGGGLQDFRLSCLADALSPLVSKLRI